MGSSDCAAGTRVRLHIPLHTRHSGLAAMEATLAGDWLLASKRSGLHSHGDIRSEFKLRKKHTASHQTLTNIKGRVSREQRQPSLTKV